jgi:transposase InsO family protein
MAIATQRPGAGLIHHSDRGVQYASAEYRKMMQSAQHYATREEARRDIFAYIEGFYNRTRRHSAIGYLSPIEMELKAA